MPSTYTANGGIELPANGEQSATWGSTVNDNMSILDRITNGVGSISLAGTTHTLPTTDGTLSDGQNRVLVLGGSPSGPNTITVTPNNGQHIYIIKNLSGQTATFTQGSGSNVSVLNGTTKIIYCDGGGSGAAVVDLTATFDLGSLVIGGNTVTASAAELNIMDGVTATTAEINIMDGVTATTAEINIMDGVTATTAEINIMDGVTATTSEINIMDGITATTAELNTLDGFTGSVVDFNFATNLNALGISYPEYLTLDGITATTAELNIMDGVTATTAELNYVDGVTSPIQTQLNTLDALQGRARGFITFNGATGATIKALNLTLSKTGTGNYNITCDSSIRDGTSNWCIVVGSVDKGVDSQTPSTSMTQTFNHYNAYVKTTDTDGFTIDARLLYNEYAHFGGNDNNTSQGWGITSVDPTYISIVVY